MDAVGQLVRHAGARVPVEKNRSERVYENVRRHWQEEVIERGDKRSRRPFRSVAMAAGAALLIGTVFMFTKVMIIPKLEPLAHVERVVGELSLAGQSIGAGGVIFEETPILTGADNRMALRMGGGQSLRVNHSTNLIIHSARHLTLNSGAIYIDTAYAADSRPILVTTPVGSAQDIGTQFQVRVTRMNMVVGVRKGTVEISHAGQDGLSVEKGYVVEVDEQGENVTASQAPNDLDWDWVETVVPDFDIQDRTLEAYLEWYANERGLEISWADNVSEQRARTTKLTGSIKGRNLDQGFELVRQIAPFEYRLSTDKIWLRIE